MKYVKTENYGKRMCGNCWNYFDKKDLVEIRTKSRKQYICRRCNGRGL